MKSLILAITTTFALFIPHQKAHALNLGPVAFGVFESPAITYHDGFFPQERFLVVSVQEKHTSEPRFQKILSDGSKLPYAIYSDNGLPVKQLPIEFENKLTSIRYQRGTSVVAGGFSLGEIFFPSGRNGEIIKINANGTVLRDTANDRPAPWSTIPGVNVPIRGVFHDRDNVFQGALLALTQDGKLFKLNASGAVIGGGPIASVGSQFQLEGCTIVPNNSSKYGNYAGGIFFGVDNIDQITGAQTAGLWFLPPGGSAYQLFYHAQSSTEGTLDSNPTGGTVFPVEDLKLIDSDERFFVVDFNLSQISGDRQTTPQFGTADFGDILVVQENQIGARDAGMIRQISYVSSVGLKVKTLLDAGRPLEQAVFAPFTITPTIFASATVPSVAEGDSGTIQITSSNPVDQLSVTLQISGTATPGADFALLDEGGALLQVDSNNRTTITIQPGSSAQVTVFARDDSIREGNETITASVVQPSPSNPQYNPAPAPSNQGTVTIVASDNIPLPSGWTVYDLGVAPGLSGESRAFGIGSVNSSGSAMIGGSLKGAASGTNRMAYFVYVTPSGSSLGAGNAVLLSPSSPWSTVNAIASAADEIAGQFPTVGSGIPSGFLFDTLFGTLLNSMPPSSPGYASTATSIALVNGGVVAAGNAIFSTPVGPVNRGVFWQLQSFPLAIGSLVFNDPSKQTYVNGINDLGHIVGRSQIASGVYHGFRTTRSLQPILASDDLQVPLGQASSEAFGINSFDETVGSAGPYAVFWLGNSASSAYTQLVAPPTGGGVNYAGAVAINNLGVSIGWRQSGTLNSRVPVLWWNDGSYCRDLQPTESGPLYLNPTIVGGGTWKFKGVTAINNSNWIVGFGERNGTSEVHGFLMKPN